MGKDLCSSFPVAKHVFEEANEALGWSLSNVMFTTDKTEQVNLTPFAQPAILVFSIALFEIFKEVNLISRAASRFDSCNIVRLRW